MSDCVCGRPRCAGFGGAHFDRYQFDPEVVPLGVMLDELHETEGSDVHANAMRVIKPRFEGRDEERLDLLTFSELERPVWVYSDEKLQAFLLALFPQLKTDTAQRRRAARVTAILYWYYRVYVPASEIAADLGTTVINIKVILHRLRKKAEDLGFGKM